jgi:hypothetical protein
LRHIGTAATATATKHRRAHFDEVNRILPVDKISRHGNDN